MSASASATDRLEAAVGDAFAFLGFDVEPIGGAGRTDLVLFAPLGVRQFTVVVDAKATQHAAVANAGIDWLAIRRHRAEERADYACVVGPAFAGGQLLAQAREFEVVLLAAEMLARLVTTHTATPWTLTELRALFTAVPSAETVRGELEGVAGARARFQRLVERVFFHVDRFSRNQPDVILAKADVLFGSLLSERDPVLAGLTPAEVERLRCGSAPPRRRPGRCCVHGRTGRSASSIRRRRSRAVA